MISLSLAALWSGIASGAHGPAATPLHTLDIVFEPASTRLSVSAVLTLALSAAGSAVVTLSPRAQNLTLSAGGAALRYARSGETIRIHPRPGTKTITLTYILPLDTPPEELPATMDNPGAMASDAVCGPDWAMLMPGSLWHPKLEDAANAYRLRLTAPAGITAVTQGALAAIDAEASRTETTWDVPRPQGRLGLCLAPYRLETTRDAPAPVQTFLLKPSSRLAPIYLPASAKHLKFYAHLHGTYPFEKFAVAENPLPTGYGFPSYTLLGSQVIALPFIPATSLRHEIAHSWWGNGVLVDEAQGNWCEGLTTYVADYLAQEEDSPRLARAYRLRTLRAFAALAGNGGDMPLARFDGRYSPASQAVGYGKALFVFHMLRGFVGDEAFWQGLRTLYGARLFKRTSWEDIRRVFAGLPGFDNGRSRAFFTQWLTRAGGPVLRLEAASSQDDPGGGATVTATVSQAGKPYLLKLTLQVETDSGITATDFILDGPSRTVSLHVPGKPRRIALDPEANSFRLLALSEVPPTVNAVKASRSLTVVVAEDSSAHVKAALPRLLAGLGQEAARIVPESSLDEQARASLVRIDLLLVGTPRFAIPGLDDFLARSPESDTVFTVQSRPGGLLATFQARSDADAQAVTTAAAKITHYGAFGLLGFKDGRNVMKDTPEPESSPLVWTF
jgi:hypothetical protein